jgi:hypothetical protein
MPSISREQLQNYARDANVELRLTGAGDDPDTSRIETREGTWHGRLARWVKTSELGEADRSGKRAGYGGAHQAVYQSLKEIYGEQIADTAFRSGGFGHERDGEWVTNTDHPLTGRHIAKMLETADREVQRNAGIGGWIGGIRQPDRGEAPDVLLGAKVSVPHGRIPVEQAFRHISADLDEDRERRLVEGHEEHGLWVLDLGLGDGERARLGIHSFRDDPGVFNVFHDGSEYIVPRKDLAEWLQTFTAERFQDRLTDMALHRGEDDTASSLIAHGGNELDEALASLNRNLNTVVSDWNDKALSEIRNSSALLRSNTGLPMDGQELKLKVDLQLAQINTLLNGADATVTQQLFRDEYVDFHKSFRALALQHLMPVKLPNEVRQPIVLAFFREAEACLGDMRANRQSMTDPDVRRGLVDRLGAKLNEELENVNAPGREEICKAIVEGLDEALARAVDEQLITERTLLQQVIVPYHGRVVEELENQRAKLEARSKELDVPIGVQMEPVNVEGILKPANSVGKGERVEWESDSDLSRLAPVLLRFSRQGDDIVASVPNLFGTLERGYEHTNRRVLTMEKVVQDHETRLSGDLSGVPGKGAELQISPQLMNRIAGGELALRVGDGGMERLDMSSVLQLKDLTNPDGNPLDLSDEQLCGLTRFLDDGVFRDMYEQAVRRLHPPGRPPECRSGVEILVQTSWGGNDRPVVDITFRSPLPEEGDDLRYQALDQDGVLRDGEPVRDVERDDLMLSVTLHVPLDQLQAGRPQVTLDEPGVMFRNVPEDYEDALRLR